MEAARTSETSVDNYFTRQYIPEDKSEHGKMIMNCKMCKYLRETCRSVLFCPDICMKWLRKTVCMAVNRTKFKTVTLRHNCYGILFTNTLIVALGGLVVSVFAIGPKIRGFNPGWGRCIFRGYKNPQHDFFGGKIKPSIIFSYILRTLKNHMGMKEILRRQISTLLLAKFPLLRY
jgi:hypothetical protein